MIKNENNNSPSKPQRVLVEQKSNVSIAISTPAFLSLAKKAGRNKVSLLVLEQVYCRGLLESVPSSKHTPEQQAFQRCDSFIHQGRAYRLDSDLISETPKVLDGAKHMHIIKRAIKGFEKRNQINEGGDLGYMVGRGLHNYFYPKKSKNKPGASRVGTDYDSYAARRRQRDVFAARYDDDRNNEKNDAYDYVSREGGIIAAKTLTTNPDLTPTQRQDLGTAMIKRHKDVAARLAQRKADQAAAAGQGAVKAYKQKNTDKAAVRDHVWPKKPKTPNVSKTPKGPPNIG